MGISDRCELHNVLQKNLEVMNFLALLDGSDMVKIVT